MLSPYHPRSSNFKSHFSHSEYCPGVFLYWNWKNESIGKRESDRLFSKDGHINICFFKANFLLCGLTSLLNLLFCVGVWPVNNIVIVSGEQGRDSAIHISMYRFWPKLPSYPGCHITLSRVPVLYARALLVIHFKYSRAIPIYLIHPHFTVGMTFLPLRWGLCSIPLYQNRSWWLPKLPHGRSKARTLALAIICKKLLLGFLSLDAHLWKPATMLWIVSGLHEKSTCRCSGNKSYKGLNLCTASIARHEREQLFDSSSLDLLELSSWAGLQTSHSRNKLYPLGPVCIPEPQILWI